MNSNRRFESISGLGAALLGILALIYILFGSLYQGTSSSGQGRTANMLQVGIQPITIVALSIILLALLGVAISSIIHGRTGGKKWQVILGVSVLIIAIITLLTLPSVGLFLLPSLILGIVTFVLSFITGGAAIA